MEEVLIETLVRIAGALEFTNVILFFIFIVQTLTLFFKDNNGGFYLQKINETLKNIVNKIQ
jgi:hypothetical protein